MKTKKRKIGIIGGGNGAHALAFHLSSSGNKVFLYPGKKFINSLETIYNRKSIIATGVLSGKAVITPLKTPLELKHLDIIFIIVPSFAQEILFEEIAKYIRDDQLIVSMPGNMASLCYKRILNKKNIKVKPIFAESFSILHGARIIDSGKVFICGLKKNMIFSVLEKSNREKGFKLLKEVIPIPISLGKNILSTALNNYNGIVHPVTCLLNAGRIDSGKNDWFHYKDGITEHVANVLELLDKERMLISDRFHADAMPFLEGVANIYEGYNSIKEFASNSHVHNAAHMIAKDFEDRYISEDVPYILTLWLTFAKLANIHTPILESCLTLISAASKKDYFALGRNLTKLGLEGMPFNEIYKENLKQLGLENSNINEVMNKLT